MTDRKNLQDLNHHLLNASRVLILTHQQPDLDAIGSALSWSHQLKAQGISSYIFVADKLYNQFDFLPGLSAVQKNLPKFKDFDTLLVLDCSNLSRVKNIDSLKLDLNSMTVINIDHHTDNTFFGNVNLVEDISSVGELSCMIFSELKWTITPDIATCLYAAILFDTGCFTNTNVSPQTFRVCAQLVQANARAHYVTEQMYESYSQASYATLRVGLERLQVRKEYAFTSIPKEVREGDIKLIEFIRKLSGIQVALVFREMENGSIKVSLRSKSTFSVSKFAALFGGGGHHRASGIIVEGLLKETMEQMCKKLEDVLPDPSFYVS